MMWVLYVITWPLPNSFSAGSDFKVKAEETVQEIFLKVP